MAGSRVENGYFAGFRGKTEEMELNENKRDRGRKEIMTDVESFCAQPSRPSLFLTLENLRCIAELTLAPSRDEILPVRSQEP